jgi:hypothetical protein
MKRMMPKDIFNYEDVVHELEMASLNNKSPL